MENNIIKEVAMEMLVDSLKPLKNIEGTRSLEMITDDLNRKLIDTATIIRNNRFELEFNKVSMEIKFRTTFSNQTINKDFMDEMMTIDQSKNWVESNLRNYFYLNER